MTAMLDDEAADPDLTNAELRLRLSEALAERDEAQAEKAALAEVLEVINASPGDLAPVFDAMLERAMHLCEAALGGLWTFDGDRYVSTGLRGVPTPYAEFLAQTTAIPGPGSAPYRFLRGERSVIQNVDLADEELYRAGDPQRRALVDLGGARTALQVPLRTEETVLGVITIYRQEVRPFNDRQITLLQNFAAQAVIAMENARLMNETREALEQQTATAEVLRVINSSPGDLAPVFDAILEKAVRLCDVAFGFFMHTPDGECFYDVAHRGFAGHLEPIRPVPGMAINRIVCGEHVVQIPDLAADPFTDFGNPARRRLVEAGGARTALWVALRKDETLTGVLVVFRQEVRPFTDKQIALLQSFASQAVIAMENARLITETREALEQQTATAEVLQVINSSPGNLAPVFDALLDKAMRLCDAAFGIMRVSDGEQLRTVGTRGVPPAYAEFLTRNPVPAGEGGIAARNRDGEPFVHTVDLKDDDRYRRGDVPTRRAMVDLGGARSSLSMALKRDQEVLGAIHIYRQEVRPFTDNQIALLQNFAAQAVIAIENARLITETHEALDQQTATSEVLQVINSSPGNLAPVFEAMLEKATRLCEGEQGVLWTFDGEHFHATASLGVSPEFARFLREPLRTGPETPLGRVMRGERLVYVADMAQEPVYRSGDVLARAGTDLGNVRSLLIVGLTKDDKLLGAFAISRREVRPFSDRQIALLKNFAAQAVIAIENARLITETKEALEQQTATAEVLGVINSSPGDLSPVFDAMLGKATRLCDAAFGFLWTWDGEQMHRLAFRGVPDDLIEEFRQPLKPPPGSIPERIITGERVVFDVDVLEGPRRSPTLARLGARSCVGVALRKEHKLLGGITMYRREVRPFAQKQLGLLESFAAQAVIAMENARLITETREALEQQTATAEVLQVINSSPGDIIPVFNAMLEKAVRLCEAANGVLFTQDGDRFRAVALRDVPEKHAEFLQHEPLRLGPDTFVGRVMLERCPLHVADLTKEEPYLQRIPIAISAVEVGGTRTMLTVPLMKDDAFLGIFQLSRQEVRPFSDKQIALVQNFAAQAVIAMENARLITETREALEQQTATAEVLQVINSSPGNLAPVFDAMLEKATSLCEAAFGILWTYDGERYHAAAFRNVPQAYAEFLREPPPLSPETALGRIAAGELLADIRDMAAHEIFGLGSSLVQQAVKLGGFRTVLGVALRREEVLLGAFTIYRQEVRPFSEKQNALLLNFAAQAVIAMENARLMTETREALERQTATAEILQVINSSPTDLQPVFQAIADSAARLCNALSSSVYRFDGQLIHFLAHSSFSPDAIESTKRLFPAPPSRDNATARAVLECALVHIPDVRDDPEYRNQEWASAIGLRSALSVPMLREGRPIGVITVNRAEAAPFPQAQISLLKTFADQAVIAIENTRLITETREALEQQTATAEVLQVINSSPGDLAPVFDAILEKAHTLCGASAGGLLIFEGEEYRVAAVHGELRLAQYWRTQGRWPLPPRDENTPLPRLMRGERLVHLPDATNDDGYRGSARYRKLIDLGGARALLAVPLRKDETLLGVITAFRQEVRPFSEREIALIENFAAQAVIAMENARLITETREALEQQTATAEVLRVINSSPGDLAPIFDAMLEKAMRLCGAAFGQLATFDGERFHTAATLGVPPAFAAYRNNNPPNYGPGTTPARILEGESVIHTYDLKAEPAYRVSEPNRRAIVDLGGARSAVIVGLRRDDAVLGFIEIYRQEVRPFSDKQIALLQNFAAQAVIAMENARLITETREALEQQTATADILRIISGSTTDPQPVFEAIVERAIKLCNAEFAGVARFDDDGLLRLAAISNLSPEEAAAFHSLFPRAANRGFVMGRAFLDCHPVNVEDVLSDPEYDQQTQARLLSASKYRSFLGVPMLRNGKAIGVIGCARRPVEAFTAADIEVLSTFADQAVIAIENARLLAELRDRQAELRVTFDNMGDGVVMFDENLRLAAWNRNFQELLDFPDAALAERPTYAEYLRLLANRGEFGTVDIEAEVSRRLEDTDQEFRQERARPDGRVIEVRRNAVPDGGFVLIYSDITDRKRSEAEIRAARDAAEATLRDLRAAQANLIQAEKMASLGQLTAGIAHEIKNPLNFVNNFAGLSVELLDELKETAAPGLEALGDKDRADVDETIEMLTSNLEKIAEHGKRADNIVKSMLDHSRGGTGERRRVDLNSLIDEALNLAYHGGRAQDQSFNITLERDFDTSFALIELVPQDITRVCLNLFGNGFYAATKRQKEGGDPNFKPTLKVSTRDLGDAVEIRARDNGIGIPPEIRDKLFQPFFTTKPTGEGTGLGLSISYDIVTQQHGGTIEVDSRVGEFTEFTVRLPRRPTTTGAAA